eukprot:m.17892 g.17892  ORF g.17892 m.17892 type:complete len:84 (-) comp7613_c0_seq1:1625-1876(-)
MLLHSINTISLTLMMRAPPTHTHTHTFTPVQNKTLNQAHVTKLGIKSQKLSSLLDHLFAARVTPHCHQSYPTFNESHSSQHYH